MKNILIIIKLFIISSFLFLNGINGQGLPVDDFSLPICGNAEGESDTLHFHNDYFDTTGCNQRIVLVAIFTTW